MKAGRAASAHSGLAEWLLQRATALYLAAFSLYALVQFLLVPVGDQSAWKAWFASGFVRIAVALFFASLLIHAWIGMRSVYIDYLRPLWLRFTASLLTAVGLIALALWCAQILLEAA